MIIYVKDEIPLNKTGLLAMSKRLIIGTAGHVDHGKTSLIKALTGVNTDRLKEEQERGMSIELGFAMFQLPSGALAGIVDVPGHERFIKNMLAGAGGMDLVLFVVAADEGVMPQTLEHLDILQILQAKSGIVVITKKDLVEEDWLALVKEEIAEHLKGTFLEKAPVVAVSNTTGEGLDTLVALLDQRAQEVQEKSAQGPFRLPIDRVFTIPGFGTVVTGTLWSGRIRLGDTVEIQPTGLTSRVRGLQSHGQKVEEAVAGSRTAVNLSGIEVSQIQRGEVLAPPGLLTPSYILDAHLYLLPRLEHPLKNRTRIRFHWGTAETIGRVILLDREELLPGESAPVQLHLEEPVACLKEDRYVLRLYSPMITLGGGTILNPVARRHKRFDPRILAILEVLEAGSLEEQVSQITYERGLSLVTPGEVARLLGQDTSQVTEILGHLAEKGYVLLLGGRYLHRKILEETTQKVVEVLRKYHQRYPLRQGMGKEELKSRVAPQAETRTWNLFLGEIEREGVIITTPTTVRLSSHQVEFTPQQAEIARKIEEMYLTSGFNPPSEEEIQTLLAGVPQGNEIFDALVEQGKLVKIAPGLFLHQEAVRKAEALLRKTIEQQGPITVAQFRDILGSSRKIVVPLLEYFDSRQVTLRQGDVRRLA